MATLLLAIIYLAFIGRGLPDALLGCAWPVACAELGVSTGLAGVVNITSAVGTVISSLLSSKLIRRFGTQTVTAVSIAMTAVALFMMGYVESIAAVLILSVPLGLGAGTVDTALNNYVALHYNASHMNWLHCFWGVGASGGPLVMALFLANNDWHGAYRAVALALALIAATVFASFPLWKKLAARNAAHALDGDAEAADTPSLTRRELIKLPGAGAVCIAFLAYSGVEGTCGLWASSYLVSVRGVDPATASSWASMYFLGITAGRLVSGFAAIKLSDKALVRIGEGMILAGLALMLLPLPAVFQMIALLLIGVGSAPVFPSLLDETPELFGKANSQGIMGLQFAAAYIGSTVLCPLFGLISKFTGLEAYPIYLIVMAAALICANETVYRKAAAHAL